MFVQTEVTPNPNSLKFLPGKKVSNDIPIEIVNKNYIIQDGLHRISILKSKGMKNIKVAPPGIEPGSKV